VARPRTLPQREAVDSPARAGRRGWLVTLRRTIRLYWILRLAAWRSALQYRLNILFMVAAGVAYQGVGFVFVWVLLHSFPTLAGWGLREVLFLYGLRLVAHALWLVCCDGFQLIDRAVREGEFERMLLRPVNPLIQLATYERQLDPFGDLLTGLTMFGIALGITDIDWTLWKAVYCVLAVIGGALIEASFHVGVGSLAFRLQNLRSVQLFIDDSMSILGSYPHGIFSPRFQWFLTFTMPIAFIAYLPASVLLERTDGLVVPGWLGYASPLVGVLVFMLAYRVWSWQMRHYQGVGH